MNSRVIPDVFDDLKIGVTLHDPKTGEILGVNNRLEDLYGYTATKLREMEVSEYSADSSRFTQAEIEDRIRAAATGDPQTFEWHIKRSDGGMVWVSVRAAATTLDGDEYVIAKIQDITERKSREQELAIKNQAIEEAPVGITLTDAEQEDNPLVYANEAFTDLVGYSTEEIQGWNHRMLQGDATREEPVAAFRRAIDNEESTTVELRNYTKDDEMFWNRVSLAPLSDESGTVTNWVGFQEDVTDRKRREQELETTKERLDTVVSNVPMILFAIDADGEFTLSEGQGLDALGLEPGEIVGESVFDIYHDQPEITADIKRALDGETIKKVQEVGELFFKTAYQPVVEDGEVTGVIGVSTDITERKQREQELHEQREILDQISENLDDVIWMNSPETKEIEFVSAAYEDIWGRPVESVYEDLHSFTEAIHEADRERVLDALDKQQQDPESYDETYRIVQPDGSVRWVHDRAFGVRADDGTLTHVVGIATDITERRERERELESERSFIQQSLDTLEDAFYMLDTDGNIQRWNDSFAEVTGYTDAEIAEMHALDFFPAEQQATISEEITEVLEDGSTVVEADYLTKDGQRIPYEITGSRFTDAEGTLQGIIGTGRDITDRKEHLRTLKKQERAFRHLHETASKSAPFEEKIEELLEFGREYMGVEQGNFTRINDGVQEIVIPVGDNETNQAGDTAPLSEAYCRHTLEKTDAGPFTVQDAVAEGWEDDPAYKRFGLACYAGAPVTVDGETVGTVCFLDRDPRKSEFTEIQKTYVDLLAEWASYELERAERERKYRRLTERITSGYYAIDTDWNFTYWNDVMEQRQGISAEENIGENFWEQYPEIEGTVMGETLREAMESGEQTSCEFYYEPMDYWTRLQVYPDEDGISVLSTDITERKEREQELKRSQTLMRQTERLASTGGWAVDLTNGKQRWTDGTREIHGVDQAYEPTLDDGLSFYHPDDRERIQQVFERCVEVGEPYDEELRLLTADDRLRWVRTRGEPTPEDETEYDAWGAIQDITDRKEREQELERSNERLEQFAYVASHDLQEPLRTISNYIELVAEEYGDQLDEEAEGFIDTVVTSSQRMQSMLNGLLDYSRVTTRGQEFEPVDADQLVGDIVKDVQFMLEEHDGTVDWEQLPTVNADPSQLRQVLQNLVTNALEHGGEEPVGIDIRATETDDGYQFEVEDDGDGIAANRQEKIFRIFKSSEQDQTTGQARGIGLAICENIVTRHGGEIWVDSEPGEGSRFVFTIEDT